MNTKTKEQFQNFYNFNFRCEQSQKIREKNKDKIPVILHRLNYVSANPEIDKKRYLVHKDELLGNFLQIVKKKLFLKSHEALFLFINNKIPKMTSQMLEIYEKECDNDGFLYLDYSIEEVFG
jgi:GABA(A) receptor-associated protein